LTVVTHFSVSSRNYKTKTDPRQLRTKTTVFFDKIEPMTISNRKPRLYLNWTLSRKKFRKPFRAHAYLFCFFRVYAMSEHELTTGLENLELFVKSQGIVREK